MNFKKPGTQENLENHECDPWTMAAAYVNKLVAEEGLRIEKWFVSFGRSLACFWQVKGEDSWGNAPTPWGEYAQAT